MQYKDDLANGYVNGYFVGKTVGSRTPDALASGVDYDNERNFVRQGAVLPDDANPGVPEPLVDEEPEEEGA